MPIFKLTAKSNAFVVVLLAGILAGVPPLFAQSSSEAVNVEPGDTFGIDRPVDSSFHSWELRNYDVRKLSLILKQPADTIGNYRYVFEALGEGQVTLVFEKYLNTAISTEKIQTHTVSVTVEESPAREDPEPDPAERTEAPARPGPARTDRETRTNSRPGDVDETVWDQVQELIETGNYNSARETIDEQIQKTAGKTRQKWMELKAESYREEENYNQAIEVWQSMLDEFPNGPRAKWLFSIAGAHVKNDAPDQAQLSYMEIRHRFPESNYWPKAMRKLAELALGNNNVDRARRLLERTRSRVNESNRPKLLMQLGKIYDRYPSTRDYPKAVRYYEMAAKAFDRSDTRSRTARDRARYLNQNFLKFGTE